MLSFLLLSLLSSEGVTRSEDVFRIQNASELIEFATNVNDGTSYSGSTIFLEADIEFTEELSQQFEPIGKKIGIYFYGTFDGQGHTISDLAINSTY